MAEELERLRGALDPQARDITATPMLGGLDWGTYAIDLVGADGHRSGVVLRRHEDPERGLDAARRLWSVLQALRGIDVPAPRPVLFDQGAVLGAPVVVMSRVPGVVRNPPAEPTPWIDALAGILAAIHSTDIARLPADFRRCPDPIEQLARERARGAPPNERVAWTNVLETLDEHVGALQHAQRVLCHKDFWYGNVLWTGDRISGVIDWSDACIDAAGGDVAYARLDMHLTLGRWAAERFRRSYERRTRPIDNLGYWDLRATLPAFRFLDEWHGGYVEIGLDLDAALARQRLAEFTRDALARL